MKKLLARLVLLLAMTSRAFCGDAENYFNQGIEKAKEGDWHGAETNFDRAIEMKPDFAFAYNNRGIAKKIRHDWAGAIDDYSKAIELKTNFALAYNNRGFARYVLSELDDALDDFNKAIELKPDFAYAYNGRGITKYKKGDLDGAISDYTKAIVLKPDFAMAYQNRGFALMNKADGYDNAKADLDKSAALEPDLTLDQSDPNYFKKSIDEMIWLGGMITNTDMIDSKPDELKSATMGINLGDTFTNICEPTPSSLLSGEPKLFASTEIKTADFPPITYSIQISELNGDSVELGWTREREATDEELRTDIRDTFNSGINISRKHWENKNIYLHKSEIPKMEHIFSKYFEWVGISMNENIKGHEKLIDSIDSESFADTNSEVVFVAPDAIKFPTGTFTTNDVNYFQALIKQLPKMEDEIKAKRAEIDQEKAKAEEENKRADELLK
jgi:tetratricopeptide (TPR) repeat protein